MPDPTPTTFFSYSRTDSKFVLRLATDLRNAGAKVWLDQLDIGAGQLWDSAIEAALRASPRQVVVLSPEAVNSQNVMDEVSYALEEHNQVIPVLYRDCQIPFRLRRVQHIDFRTDYNRGLRDLLKALGVMEQGAPETADPKLLGRPLPSDLAKTPEPMAGTQSTATAQPQPATIQRAPDHSSTGSAVRVLSKRLWVVAMVVCVLALAAGIWYFFTPTPTKSDDASIVEEIKSKIAADSKIPEKDIDVQLSQGAVRLSGKVSSDAARSAAGEDAQVDGVKMVINNLLVTRLSAQATPTPRPSPPPETPTPMATPTPQPPTPTPTATPGAGAVIGGLFGGGQTPKIAVPVGRRVAIMNANSGLCLSPAGGTDALNNPNVQFTCDGDPARFWTFRVEKASRNSGTALVMISNSVKGLCLTVAGGNTALNTTSVQYTCDNDPSRRWLFMPIDATTFRLVNMNSKLCLTIAGGGNAKNNEAVQYRCDADTSRNWKIK